jgi:hypothetical protein
MAGILDFFGNNSDALISAGVGLMSAPGWGNGIAAGLQGFQYGNQIDTERAAQQKLEMEKKQRNDAMAQFLATQQMTPQQRAAAMANQEIGQSLLTSSLTAPKRDIREVGGSLVDITGDKPNVLFQAPKDPSKARAPVSRQRFDEKSGHNIIEEWNPETGWQTQGRAPQRENSATEDQRKNAQLYSVAQPELGIVEKNFDELARVENSTGYNIANKVGLGNYASSEGYQQGRNSLKTIIASYLYSSSGAAASAGEIENQTDILMPKPGESAASLADKKARIKNMVESIKYRAGTTIGGSGAPGAPFDAGDGVTITPLD